MHSLQMRLLILSERESKPRCWRLPHAFKRGGLIRMSTLPRRLSVPRPWKDGAPAGQRHWQTMNPGTHKPRFSLCQTPRTEEKRGQPAVSGLGMVRIDDDRSNNDLQRLSDARRSEPTSLKGGENRRRGGVIAVPLMVFAFCALLFFYITWWIPRQAGFVPRSVFASLETEKSDAGGRQNLPTNGVWERLRAAYPELRGDRLMWHDVSGTTHLAVPQPFWDGLSSTQRRALGGELDRALNTERWEVVTGRYEGNGKMMLDHAHSRADVLSGR